VEWWKRLWRRSAAEEELVELRAEVSELRERLSFVNQKHEQLVAQEGVPMQENSVLRFDLQRCQRDRLVLEAHLASARGALRMTRGVARAETAPAPLFEWRMVRDVSALLRWTDGPLTSSVDLARAEVRQALEALEGGALSSPDVSMLGPWEAEMLRLLDAFEGWRDSALRGEQKLAEGLAALDPKVEQLHAALLGLHAALLGAAEAGGSDMVEESRRSEPPGPRG